MRDQDLLDQKVVSQKGPVRVIRRWWKGIHPDKGVIVKGWTGWETVEEKVSVRPTKTVYVAKSPAMHN